MMRLFSKSILFLAVLMILAGGPIAALAADADCPAGYVCPTNPLAVQGITEPGQLVVAVVIGFAGMMGSIAIAFTVYTAFKLVVATNEEAIKSAREGVLWSVVGFAISILSFTAVAGVSKILGYKPEFVESYDQLWNPVGRLTGDSSSFGGIMNRIMINFLGLLGFAATLMIVYHGFRYLTSAGNEEAIEKAKQGLRWSIGGLVIVLLVFTIISAVRKYLLFGV